MILVKSNSFQNSPFHFLISLVKLIFELFRNELIRLIIQQLFLVKQWDSLFYLTDFFFHVTQKIAIILVKFWTFDINMFFSMLVILTSLETSWIKCYSFRFCLFTIWINRIFRVIRIHDYLCIRDNTWISFISICHLALFVTKLISIWVLTANW